MSDCRGHVRAVNRFSGNQTRHSAGVMSHSVRLIGCMARCAPQRCTGKKEQKREKKRKRIERRVHLCERGVPIAFCHCPAGPINQGSVESFWATIPLPCKLHWLRSLSEARCCSVPLRWQVPVLSRRLCSPQLKSTQQQAWLCLQAFTSHQALTHCKL